MRTLRNHFFRIDARSLGLFRIAFAVVLIGDLLRRWKWITAFYSNDGVLPNHNHIFNLRETGHVFSILHAFSSPGENGVAFAIILVVYILFLVGWHTRAFHLLALFSLVSLTGRNILLENAGNYVAIALLAFTAFLPTGRRFSLDALGSSFAARDEKTADDLNDRSWPLDVTPEPADHGRGWSPVSLAAFAVLIQIALVYLCAAFQQTGAAWHNGTALYYALSVDPWVSRMGAAMRGTPGLLKPLSFLVWGGEWAIPVLILVPVARRQARWGAIALVLVHGLILGLLLDLGLYAWTLVAAAPLLVTDEMWERAIASMKKRGTQRTVIYDADCGVCLALARLLKRIDFLELVAFQSNDDLPATPANGETEGDAAPAGELSRRAADGSIERAPLPAKVTRALADVTLIVVDADGRVFTRGDAIAKVLSGLPFGGIGAAIVRLPGIAQLADFFYAVFAKRRMGVSVLLGMGECGIPIEGEEEAFEDRSVPPASRTLHRVTGAIREVSVAIVFVAMLAQTTRSNHLPGGISLPQGRFLYAVAAWPRMLARWDVLAPSPPTTDTAYVIDGQTKGGRSVDLLSGREPQLDLATMRGTGMGQLWADYLDRIHKKEWNDFQKAFRDYLQKGGIFQDVPPDDQVIGYDAYWLSSETPPPGDPRGPTVQEKLFTNARGGRLSADRLPMVRPPEMARPGVPAPRPLR